jgi:hypothetical protein
MCGGSLIRTVIDEYGSHYYNRLVNGEGYTDYDLTRLQFPSRTVVPPGTPVERDGVLNSERAHIARTSERYELLKKRLAEAMKA